MMPATEDLASRWSSPADDLLRYREEFPILENTTYLISNSLGAMPRQVNDALQDYASIWATRGVRAWHEEWWMLSRQVGDEIGALMNAPQGSVSLHQNVTLCQAVVASCFLIFPLRGTQQGGVQRP